MPKVKLLIDEDKYRKLIITLNGAIAHENKSREEVGRALGVTGSMVCNYLKNPENMQLDRLLKMARSLNVPIDELRDCIRY